MSSTKDSGSSSPPKRIPDPLASIILLVATVAIVALLVLLVRWLGFTRRHRHPRMERVRDGAPVELTMATVAKRDGFCTGCGQRIREGDEIHSMQVSDPAAFHADELHRLKCNPKRATVRRWVCDSCRPRPVRVRRIAK